MPLLSPLCDFAISSFACQIGASKLDSLRRYARCNCPASTISCLWRSHVWSLSRQGAEMRWITCTVLYLYLSFAFSLSSLSPTLEIRQKPKLLCQRFQDDKRHISRILSFCTTVKAISCSSSTCVMSHCGHDGTPFLILDVFQ